MYIKPEYRLISPFSFREGSWEGEEFSADFYEALAWSGLKESNVKAWTDLTAKQQQDINNLAARVTQMSKNG
jgi:hypothetical protein